MRQNLHDIQFGNGKILPKAVSALLATSLAVSTLGASALSLATPDTALAEDAALEVLESEDSPATNPAQSADEPVEAIAPSDDAGEVATSPAPSEEASGEDAAPEAQPASPIIAATVPLDTSGSPEPVKIDPVEAAEEEASWEDVTPPWSWPLTEDGYVAWDGTVVPNVARKGIDVSEHQGYIDWEKVAAQGIDFAIIRCGYGQNQQDQDDKYWLRNVSECERLGIPYGVYIYSYATGVETAKGEADHVLRLLEGHNPDLPVYYDIEESFQGAPEMRALLPEMAKVFCNTVQEAGYMPGVYANLFWWTHYLTDPAFESWERWVAQYNTSCEYKGNYKVWQASSKMTLDGVTSTYVDVNFDLGGYFRDVDYTSEFATNGSLDFVVDNGILGPVAHRFNFAPDAKVTRVEALEALYSMSGRPEIGFAGVGNPAVNILPFDDLVIDSPYRDAVKWARAIGLVGQQVIGPENDGTGNPINVLNPDEVLTRENLCKLLASYAAIVGANVSYNPVSLITLPDGFEISQECIPSVGWAVGAGVLPLKSVDDVKMASPKAEITRADLANVLLNMHNYTS